MDNCAKAVLLAMVVMSFALTNIIPAIMRDNAALAQKVIDSANEAQKRAEGAELSLKKQQIALEQEAKRLKAECKK